MEPLRPDELLPAQSVWQLQSLDSDIGMAMGVWVGEVGCDVKYQVYTLKHFCSSRQELLPQGPTPSIVPTVPFPLLTPRGSRILDSTGAWHGGSSTALPWDLANQFCWRCSQTSAELLEP